MGTNKTKTTTLDETRRTSTRTTYHEWTSKTQHERLPAHLAGRRRGHRSRRGYHRHHRHLLAGGKLRNPSPSYSTTWLLSPHTLTLSPIAQCHPHRFRASWRLQRRAVARVLRRPRGPQRVRERQPHLRRPSAGTWGHEPRRHELLADDLTVNLRRQMLQATVSDTVIPNPDIDAPRRAGATTIDNADRVLNTTKVSADIQRDFAENLPFSRTSSEGCTKDMTLYSSIWNTDYHARLQATRGLTLIFLLCGILKGESGR